MKNNKKFPTLIALIALILTGCACHKHNPSSIASSINSEINTTSVISEINTTSSVEDGEPQVPSSSANSSIYSSSDTSSEAISSSNKDSSSSSSSSSEYSVPPVEQDTNWNINLSLRGAEFRNALQTIMAGKQTRTTSYSDCLSLGAKAAAYPNANSSTFVPFYHDASKLATTGQCNREHTWPNSRGTGTSGPGADPFIIRPTLTSENSDRGNNFYGTKGKANKEWDPASCGFEAARGESARVILYAATMYYKNGLSLSNNPSDSTDLKTMGTLSTLLTWNNTYAPTPIEIQINNYLSNNGYGRNPFVDHPEYASYIWDRNGLLGGEIPPDPSEFDDGLTIESSLSNLDGNEFVIASSDSNTSFQFYAMDNEAKSATLPWYIKPLGVSLSEDKTKLIPNDGVTLKYYKFIKQSDGNYYIRSKETNNYLFGYIDGTHYSIGLGTTPTNNGSLSWNITTNGMGFTFKNATNVYFEYYNGSFCGYKNAPSVPIYLYR
jgi:endonuclease I